MASNKIRGITIELNADNAGIMDALKEINGELASTQKALADTNKLLKLDPENVTLLTQKQEYLTKAIDDTQKKLEQEKELLEQMANAENSSETQEQQKALAREIEATTQKLNGYKAELDQTTSALDNMGNESKEAKDAVSGIDDALRIIASSKAFEMISDGADKVYTALLNCVNAADQFNFSIAKIETLGASNLGAMSEEIKNNAAEIGISANELSEAVYQAISAGVDEADAVQFASEAAKFSVGGFTDAATAVDVITTAMNAYGLSMDDASHIMDNLVTTQNLGKTTVAELSKSLGKIIPTASASKVNIDQLSAAYASLTKNGISSRFATTDLNAMLDELGKEGSTVSNILKEQTGKSFAELMESGSTLTDVLKILKTSVKGSEDAFKNLWSSSTASKSALTLAGQGAEDFDNALIAMNSNIGASNDAFETMANTSVMLSQKWESSVNNLQIAIGDALSPALDTFTQIGIAALEPITQFIEDNPMLVAAISGIVIGVTAVAAAVAIATVAQTLWNAVCASNPFIAMAMAITAAIGAIVAVTAAMAASSIEFANKIKDVNDSIKSNRESVEKLEEDFKSNSQTVRNAAQTIKELGNIENRTTEQQLKLESAVNQWNEAMGESNQILLDENGNIIDNTDALEDNLDAMAKAYEMEMKKAELEEIVKNYAQAERDLEEAKRLEAEAQEKYNEVQDEFMYNTLKTLGYFTAEDELLKQSQSTVQDASDTLEMYKTRYEELTEEVKNETEAEKQAREEFEANQAAIEEEAKRLEELEESYNKTKESAISSLEGQRKAFEDFDQKAAQSVDDIATSFEKQAQNMTSYAGNVAKAYEIMKADPEANDLLEYYIKQGPSAAGELANLVNAFNDGGDALEDFNNAVKAFNETENLIDAIGSMQSAIESGYTEPMEQAIAQLNIDIPETREILAEGYELQQEDAEKNQERMTEIATGTVTDMKDAVEENAQFLNDANTQLMEAALQAAKDAILYDDETGKSTAYYNLGMAIDQSVADGISDNAGVVSTALQNSLNNAINNVDVSGLASRINSLLGEQLS